MLETLQNGAIIFDRADCEVEGRPAEVIHCFIPGNAMTPFAVWHRFKGSQDVFWGQFYPGKEAATAVSYFKERKDQYRGAKQIPSPRDLQVISGKNDPLSAALSTTKADIAAAAGGK